MKDKLTRYMDLAEKAVTTRTHRLGVTGFARAGKTVFVTQLTHSLLRLNEPLSEAVSRHPLTGLDAFDAGQLQPARLRENSLAKRSQFKFYQHRDSMMGRGQWPEPTSDLTWLALEIKRTSNLAGWKGMLSPSNLELEIMDYPGEWLSDLPLMQMTYSQWSDSVLSLANQDHRKEISQAYRKLHEEITQRYAGQGRIPEDQLRLLQEAWKDYLQASHEQGFVLNQPSRILMPGEMQNWSIINFIPIHSDCDLPDLKKKQARMFDVYKKEIEKKLGQHFQKLDSQIIMVDLLRALEQGKEAMDELKQALHDTLKFFRYSASGSLIPWMSRKIKRVVFAATKADQLTQEDRSNLECLLGSLLNEVDPGNDVSAQADVNYLALASVESATPAIDLEGNEYVEGKELNGNTELFYSGRVPAKLPLDWDNITIKLNTWAPLKRIDNPQKLLPAYQLGRAINYLLKDEL